MACLHLELVEDKKGLYDSCMSRRKSPIEMNGSWIEAKAITCLFVVVA